MALIIFLLISALAAACFLMGIYCERDVLAPERNTKNWKKVLGDQEPGPRRGGWG